MPLLARARTGAVIIVSMYAVTAFAQTTTAPPPQTKTAPPPTKTAPPPQVKTAPPPTKTAAPPTKAAPPPTKTVAGPTKAAAAPTKAAAAPTKSAPPPQTKTAAPPTTKTAAPPTKTVPPPTKTVAPAQGRGEQPGARGGKPVERPPAASADTLPPVIIMRETFNYEASGRRDPFLSLLTTDELRPTLSDLKLNNIAWSPQGGSVANIRDNYNKKPVIARIGTLFGRMRVVAINPNAVVFSIDEFGTIRRDSLVQRPDTTK